MTANVNIKRGDLHLAVSTAFNRGRYVLMTGGGDGRPIEITVDLRERPDDMFEEFSDELAQREHLTPSDDHGPAIPAQTSRIETPYGAVEGIITDADGKPTGHRVYEFALQDVVWFAEQGGALGAVMIHDAPHPRIAEQSDWVHVYDRVTRERRTLKRPAPDAVLTGLRDVAADLRRQSFEGSDPSKPYDGSGMVEGVADLSPLIVTRDGIPREDQGAALDEFKARCVRGDTAMHRAAVEAGYADAGEYVRAAADLPVPPVGPLTSVDGVKIGDLVRAADGVGVVIRVYCSDGSLIYERGGKTFATGCGEEIAFVGRPDASGWMTWAGGENPVPGATVDARDIVSGLDAVRSEELNWAKCVRRFRIVDTPPAV